MRFDQAELEDIVLKHVTPIHHKAKLVSFISIAAMHGCCEEQAPEPQPSDELTAEAIAAWIERTWPTKTVRALMAQKIARMIREGAWRR